MVKSLLFSSSPLLQNMFTHSYGRNLFNTRAEDPVAQRPHVPPDEGNRSRAKRNQQNDKKQNEMESFLKKKKKKKTVISIY